ncbi:ABC transporter ATP-binding protein [Saccharothrix algeriensis]|uniref:ABC transporter ATP-binding protein n=1 Tax=Saccharothrix algeriensis TaxID=173560 RepID=A0A8T8I2R1_9PSEU|nr:ABC transporter ATP-binding protein [Saccharothrix algeriensis]MBM7810837.1 ATP-binding cassette subfamily B protein [Saccharothrix algeriensis]QTR04868.1 ABC transporter ATP-binding protein [Saccharothrix algeriensis]
MLLRTVVLRDPRWLLLAVNALLATTAGLLLPTALAAAVDSALGGRADPGAVLWLVGLAGVEVVGDAVGVVLAAAITARGTAWLRRRLTSRLLESGHPGRFEAGDAVSRLTGDGAIAGGFAVLLVNLGVTVLTACGAVVALALLDWRLAAVFLLSLPPALLLVRSHLKLTTEDVTTYQEVSGELSARLLDAVGGLRTIAASGRADQEAARVLRPLPRLAAAGVGMWRTQARMIWRAGLLLPAVELAVLTAAGFGVVAGRLSVGDVLAALGYAGLGMAVVGQATVLTALQRARASAARVDEVLTAPGVADPAGREPAGREPVERDLVEQDPAGREPVEREPVAVGAVELRGVSVAGALHEVDLLVPAGAFLAVVGRSGAGKSALAAVIGGLTEPAAGRVLRGGSVGYAFERPALLGATVADAVGYGTSAGRDEVLAACRAAQVHDVVVRLPAGYDTPMADTPLSGGEAQRLGLARAVVRDPAVLVLDDATASLDTVTESTVERAVETALPGRTRVVVTHRAATAGRADAVVWLADGRVRAVAPHSALWGFAEYREVFG